MKYQVWIAGQWVADVASIAHVMLIVSGQDNWEVIDPRNGDIILTS